MPVGALDTTAWGLRPIPSLVASQNQGRNQPRTTKSRPPRTSSQKTPEASTSFVSAAVTGMSTAATTSLGTSGTGSSTAGTMGSSGTVGYPHAEQPHRAEGEHDDEHGEDDRVLPLAAEQLRAKDRDQPDQEAAETGAD